MKKALALILGLAGCGSTQLYPINTAPVTVTNDFTRQNPGYKKSAGEFYDRTHIAKASKQLYELCSIPKDKQSGSLNIIRAYSYDYLDEMVRSGGKTPLPAPDKSRLIQTMSDRFKLLLGEEEYKCFLTWRDAGSEDNDFYFLTAMPDSKYVPINRRKKPYMKDHNEDVEIRKIRN